MIHKKELEKRVLELIGFFETVISEYFLILVGTVFKPLATIKRIHFSEKVSPLLFLIINIVAAALIEDATDSNSLFKVILKSIILTTKPTWDDKLWSILGLFLGTILIILISRIVSCRLTGTKIVLSMITKSLCYGSFTFVPIAIAKLTFSFVFFFAFYEIFNIAKANPVAAGIAAVTIVSSFFIWWFVIVQLWIKSYLPDLVKYYLYHCLFSI